MREATPGGEAAAGAVADVGAQRGRGYSEGEGGADALSCHWVVCGDGLGGVLVGSACGHGEDMLSALLSCVEVR